MLRNAQTSGDNLYVGTSQAEILHSVAIPPDPADKNGASTYIFASRLQPTFNNAQIPNSQDLPGVQQILILPKIQKVCVLCNGTLSFYSLPELSPAFNNTTVPNCTWVGGVDLNDDNGTEESGVVVMICVKSKVRLVRIRDEARRVKDIEYPGCLVSVRRGNFACVADSHSYALLDVENQQKISLFPISSLDDNVVGGKVEDISTDAPVRDQRPSSARLEPNQNADAKAHGRSTSLGTLVSGLGRRQESPQPASREPSEPKTSAPALRNLSPAQPGHTRASSAEAANEATKESTAIVDKPLPRPPRFSSLHPPAFARTSTPLRPHICSPTSGEFLLVTGTSTNEAGVGIFVNLDGDVVRGTLEFSKYPSGIVLDGNRSVSDESPRASIGDREGFILAIVKRPDQDVSHNAVEIQRWDVDNGGTKQWVPFPRPSSQHEDTEIDSMSTTDDCGLRKIDAEVISLFTEVGELLRGKRLRVSKKTALLEVEDWESTRNGEEEDFGRRLGESRSSILLWSGSAIWRVVRNPLATRLEASIHANIERTPTELVVNRTGLIYILNDIRGQEATTETEFLSLEYIRQKISILLFADLLHKQYSESAVPAADLRITEALLMEGGVDPRVTLTLLPEMSQEVVEGPKGIWIHAGLVSTIDSFPPVAKEKSTETANPEVMGLMKRYLGAWRQRKGFGSIADEAEVFQTVDAALLRVLLLQDDVSGFNSSKSSPERVELYALVDAGIECFDRAVVILEERRRLFVLSRLYQSRRMGRKVLETWKRIIEGETDLGGGLVDGENEIRRYLVNIKDTALVDEYGTWLAKRNPKLGVQVFTNDNSKIKWEPQQVVMLLRRRAPDSVKEYLEHLVFGKKNVQYANDLISYYLDSVLTVLGRSDEARAILATSYESYRALHPPKPTYRQFITENAAPLSWWHDRLRLLELIGGSHGSDFTYDVSHVLSRIEPFEQDLVPESIILDGRQGRHKQALRLLTHGLGDYHTAVNYCLLGGESIFHPTQGAVATASTPTQDEQARLFGYLLTEFLSIEDISDRHERTSELLERFSLWFDVSDVLNLIPESWSVELLSGFLLSAFRRLIHEKNEAMITKALSGAENLQIAAEFVEKCTVLGPQVEMIES